MVCSLQPAAHPGDVEPLKSPLSGPGSRTNREESPRFCAKFWLKICTKQKNVVVLSPDSNRDAVRGFFYHLNYNIMSKQIFIVTRQNYYESRGINYAMAMANPVVGAWESRRMVDEFFTRRLVDFISRGCIYEHINESNSVGLLERYIIKDSDESVIVSYSVLLEYLL